MGRLAVYKFAYFLSILFTIFILGLSIFAYFSYKIRYTNRNLLETSYL